MPNRKVQAPRGGGQQARREHVVQVEELGLSREVEERRADGGHQLKPGYSVLLACQRSCRFILCPTERDGHRDGERHKNCS